MPTPIVQVPQQGLRQPGPRPSRRTMWVGLGGGPCAASWRKSPTTIRVWAGPISSAGACSPAPSSECCSAGPSTSGPRVAGAIGGRRPKASCSLVVLAAPPTVCTSKHPGMVSGCVGQRLHRATSPHRRW
jgi:hypothetical protein